MTFWSLVMAASAIDWLSTGRDLMKPISATVWSAASTNGRSAPRRKVNSAGMLGLDEPPWPLFCGSPVWSMNLSMTRKNFRPS